MTDPRDAGDRPHARTTDSLGWMVGSTVVPKKARLIEGVGMGGVLELKAELYRAQEEARMNPQARGRKKGRVEIKRSNAGVQERDRKDRAAIKTDKDRLAESAAALKRKAAMYERLAAGVEDDEDEQYNVDFFAKSGTLEDEAVRIAQLAADNRSDSALDTFAAAISAEGMVSGDMIRERERISWEEDERENMESAKDKEIARDERLKVRFKF
eukprot:jgi/Botrbrau1/4811/Bobra.0325s0031.2